MSKNTPSNKEIMDAVPHIRRFAYSLTRNAADADDLDGDLFGMLDSGAGSEQASTADANAFDISKYINSNS